MYNKEAIEAIEDLVRDIEQQADLDMEEAAKRRLPISGIAISTMLSVSSLEKLKNRFKGEAVEYEDRPKPKLMSLSKKALKRAEKVGNPYRGVKGFNEMDTISLVSRADAFAQGRWFQRQIDLLEIKALRQRVLLEGKLW